MSFGVRSFYGGNTLAICENCYDRCRSIHEKHMAALEIEEAFELAMKSYIEFRVQVYSELARQMVLFQGPENLSSSVRLTLSLRIMAFLTTCRLLREKVKRAGCWKPDDVKYSTDNFYAMEGIRNWTQHYDFPIDHTSFSMKRPEPREQNGVLIFSLFCALNKGTMLGNNEFYQRNTRACGVLDKMDDRIDILALITNYVEIVADIIEIYREKAHYREIDNEIQQILSEYNCMLAHEQQLSTSAIRVGRLTDGSLPDEGSLVFTESMANQRNYFRDKNSRLHGLAQRRID